MKEREAIKHLHQLWREAKAECALRAKAEGDDKLAEALEECHVFTGEEATMEEVIAKLHSVRGVEFMLLSGFPSAELFRQYREVAKDAMGVYIDAGDIEINDTACILLVGDTRASIECNSPECYKVTALHGAQADVVAGGYAVIRPRHDEASSIGVRTSGNAIVL